jgi:hypothetical protein
MTVLAVLNILLPSLTRILDKLIPDADARARAQEEITKAILDNHAALLQAMQAVMVSDGRSESWLTRNMRPIVVAWSLLVITWIGGVAPIFGLAEPTIAALSKVPSELWTLMTGGIGLYMAGKTATDVTRTLKGK